MFRYLLPACALRRRPYPYTRPSGARRFTRKALYLACYGAPLVANLFTAAGPR